MAMNISIGGRTLLNLCFANGIHVVAESEAELQKITDSFKIVYCRMETSLPLVLKLSYCHQRILGCERTN